MPASPAALDCEVGDTTAGGGAAGADGSRARMIGGKATTRLTNAPITTPIRAGVDDRTLTVKATVADMIRKITTTAIKNADILCYSIYEDWPVQVEEDAIRIGGPKKIRGLPVAKDDIPHVGLSEIPYVDKTPPSPTSGTRPPKILKRKGFYAYSWVTPQF
ncbi:hypothetical protein ACFZC6_42045 [Streptomyces ossamyceticus]|uniref:hypothetical protein n=1 Tax=Streptomyces ossamyceticus TaxID=249581 RepID=UPI0036ECFBA4